MTDYISRADAIEAVRSAIREEWLLREAIVTDIEALPSADADGEDLIIKGAKGIQDGLYNIKDGKLFKYKGKGGTVRTYPIVSADAVPIHEDGTLEIKVPNAHKVGRVLVKDVDSHIGGGLFYPDDAVQGEECDHCVYKWGLKGGDDE